VALEGRLRGGDSLDAVAGDRTALADALQGLIARIESGA
jgi:hypothetical protein